MEKKVTVLLPNGRRQNISVSPNTTLLEILEKACEKHGYSSEEHCLKFHNKEVSLTQMFRFSGLPNNCVLEMEPTERKRNVSNVIVCVQLEDGTRQQFEFSPNTNVWEVVVKLCEKQTKQFESPVVIYMRSEIIGKERMQQTTLKSLGILEGRAMIRFIDKKPEELKTQANVYKPPEVQEKPRNVDGEQPQTSRLAASSVGSGGFAITTDLVKSLKRNASDNDTQPEVEDNDLTKTPRNEQTEKPKPDWGTGSGYSMHRPQVGTQSDFDDEMNGQTELPPVVNIIGPRQAVVFSLDATEKQLDDLPDSFFDLTVSDLKMVLRDLKRTSTGAENSPLLTERLRELERQKTMLNKLNQYKECVLRIHFPDRHVLQGIFKPHELFSKVVEFVQGFLANPNEPFELFTTPPKNILPLDQTLLELNFVPNAVVHFAYKTDANLNADTLKFVDQKYLDQLTSEEGAHYAVQKYRLSRVKTS